MTGPLRLLAERAVSPLGDFVIVTDAQGCVRGADWVSHQGRMLTLLARQFRGFPFEITDGPPSPASRCLAAYFAGDLGAIDGLPVEAAGTKFQSAVWQVLRDIPAGQTITYRELARRACRPTAIRAAGSANGANPISIIVPCHRVIGTDGELTGYGGGVERKRWLLAHEGFRSACDIGSR
jgi:methylated-DNA-[protein]-cysteine S-methyltransferase